VLLALERHSLDDLETAVQLAMDSGTCDPDAVLAILEAPLAPSAAKALDLTGRPHLAVVRVPLPDVSRYDRLIRNPSPQETEGGNHGNELAG
jgi:hypothetical protein